MFAYNFPWQNVTVKLQFINFSITVYNNITVYICNIKCLLIIGVLWDGIYNIIILINIKVVLYNLRQFKFMI